MTKYRNLWESLCSYSNLELAFRKARKRKTKKDYVRLFEQNLYNNLQQLRIELLMHSYQQRPLKTFIVRDPKTRKISKADFRDRVIHHALCNIIEPLFDKTFIHDSYANRKDKGTLEQYKKDYQEGKITYNIIYKYLQGWLAYAKQANTHKLRKKVVEAIEKEFPDEIATLEINKLLKIDHANKAATKRV